ncbi:T9SS type A sorting domain-containing protein [Croceimicrobium sp.]|uniref:T9SS type A sorting domain-containing protein n=1 Tax=Croceimicrobium sp. TaxID=2828340 RepID=UPI003BAC69BB
MLRYLFILFLATTKLWCQQAVPTGAALARISLHLAADSSTFYALSNVNNSPLSDYVIWKGDQNGWQTIPANHLKNQALMVLDSSDIYFAETSGGPQLLKMKTTLSRYRNGSWTVLDSINGVPRFFGFFDGKPYLAGLLHDSLRQVYNVVYYENGALHQAGNLNSLDTIYGLHEFNGDLWACGNLNNTWSSNTAGIIRLNSSNNTWDYPIRQNLAYSITDRYHGPFYSDLFQLGNQLFIRKGLDLFRIQNDSLVYIVSLPPYQGYGTTIEVPTILKSKAYFSRGERIAEFDGNGIRLINPGINDYSVINLRANKDQLFGTYNGLDTINGISFNKCFYLNPTNTIGQHKYQQNSGLSLYPNPVHNELQLEWEGSVQNIRLFNSSGQSLRSWTPNTGQENLTIDLSEFTNGLYILEVGRSRFRVLKLN